MNEYQTFSTINNLIIYMLITTCTVLLLPLFISQLKYIYMQVNSNIDVFVRVFFQWLSFTKSIMIFFENNLITLYI